MAENKTSETEDVQMNENDIDLNKVSELKNERMPRRISQISAKDQRRLAKAIKRARSMALIPFVTD